MDRARLEAGLRELPLVQYAFFPTGELTFSPAVRWICEHECPQYGTTWACPPAVGTVEECRARCLRYAEALVITTMAQVEDAADLAQTLATRGEHEEVTRAVHRLLREQGEEPLVLSTESCAICPRCAYPDAPCRHPDRMYPCVESHGVLVTALAERLGMEFLQGGNLVTWYSLFCYGERDGGEKGGDGACC